MDLNQLSWGEEATLTLLNPADNKPLECDDGVPMGITTRGALTETYRRELHAVQRSLIAEQAEGDEYDLTQRSRRRLLSRLATGWTVQLDGERPPFSPERLEETLNRFPWIADQLDRFVHQPRHFSAASSISS